MTTELDPLQARIKELETIEREYLQVKNLLEQAANGTNLDKSTGDMLLYVSVETGQIADASSAALDFLGYSLAELQSQPIEGLETKTQEPLRLYDEGQTFDLYEANYRHKAGYQLRVKVRVRLFRLAGIHYMRHALEDISLQSRLWRELSRREDTDFQFREKLKTLNELNLELGRMNSLDALCRRSIELGMQNLGFDRLSIWLINQSLGRMIGTFGVDEQGQLRDEREQSWYYTGGDVQEFLAGRRQPIIIHDDAPIYNERSEQIGYGWHVSVPLFDRDEFIGFMGVDNFVNKRALQAYQPELLRLFGTTVGHHAARQREQETIRKLSSAIQASASMIIILKRQRQIDFANPAFFKLTGYSTDILGQDATFLLSDSNIWEGLEAGQDWQGELLISKHNGQYFDAFASISASNTLEHYVLVIEDISSLKHSKERELALQLEQERLQLVAKFVNDVAHEINTPLTIIKTSAYFLGKDVDEAKRQTHASRIDESVAYLNRLINAMLETVRLDSQAQLNPTKIAFSSFLRDIVTVIQTNNPKPLAWELDLPAESYLYADSLQLQRAIQELIYNAIEYSPENGKIQISLSEKFDSYSIVIQDAGMGIAAEDLDQIFQRFYRVDKARSIRHAGLGLPIAKRIIELHRGEIRVESVLGAGSRFEVILPK